MAEKRITAWDYVLPLERDSVWITVGNVSVYVHRNIGGVSVDLFPLGYEDRDPPLAGADVTFVEAAEAVNAATKDLLSQCSEENQ